MYDFSFLSFSFLYLKRIEEQKCRRADSRNINHKKYIYFNVFEKFVILCTVLKSREAKTRLSERHHIKLISLTYASKQIMIINLLN